VNHTHRLLCGPQTFISLDSTHLPSRLSTASVNECRSAKWMPVFNIVPCGVCWLECISICHRRRARDWSFVWMSEYWNTEQSSCLIIFIIFVNLVGCLFRDSTPVYQLHLIVFIVSVRQVSCSEIRRWARSDVVIHWCN